MFYLDNAATTEIDVRVFGAMEPYLTHFYGNPGSLHQLGRTAAAAVAEAREQVASAIGAMPEQIIFTSGGSEANNLAIRGIGKWMELNERNAVVVSAIEHESVLGAAEGLRDYLSASVHYAMPRKDGVVSADEVVHNLTQFNVGLASVMHMNNETGAINPVEDIATVCMKLGIPFHTDCVQSFGSIPIDVQQIGCDFLSISSHKIHGPKGIGALYVKEKTLLEPLISGGKTQEFGLRGGTENVAAIVGFGYACELLEKDFKRYSSHTSAVKQEFFRELYARLGDGFRVNGPNVTAPGKILSLTFTGVDAQTLLLMLDAKNICVSAGSACTAHDMTPSHVLKMMGMTDDEAHSTIRVSFSRFNGLSEAVEAAKTVALCVDILRKR